MSDRGWQGCQVVNPLCPSDLCDLPTNHRGHHRLSTCVEPQRLWWGIRRDRRWTTWHELVDEGWRRQKRLMADAERARRSSTPTPSKGNSK